MLFDTLQKSQANKAISIMYKQKTLKDIFPCSFTLCPVLLSGGTLSTIIQILLKGIQCKHGCFTLG